MILYPVGSGEIQNIITLSNSHHVILRMYLRPHLDIYFILHNQEYPIAKADFFAISKLPEEKRNVPIPPS